MEPGWKSNGMRGLGVAVCLLSAVVMLVQGVSPWLTAIIVLAWSGTLWLVFHSGVPEAVDIPVRASDPPDRTALLEHLGEPVLMVRDDKITYANAAARRLLGEHVVGQGARLAIRHPAFIALLANADDTSTLVTGLSAPNSVWRVRRHHLDNGAQLFELHDHTLRSDVARAHTDFVANASHELKTPIAAVLGCVETLMEPDAGGDEATRTRFLGIMGREATRMRGLVDDLMSLSRIEAGKHEPPHEQVNLVGIVRDILADPLSVSAGHPPAEFETELQEVKVAGDASQLAQVVRNLLDNAVSHGKSDKPVQIRLTQPTKDFVCLSIRDQGQGIAPEHLPRLMERFYRVDAGRSRSGGGTGLGLSIVKHIVERHRGQLDIRSAPGAGTTVSLVLPVVQEPF